MTFPHKPGGTIIVPSGLREKLILSAISGAAYKIGSIGGYEDIPHTVSALDVRLVAEKAVMLADMVMRVMAETPDE